MQGRFLPGLPHDALAGRDGQALEFGRGGGIVRRAFSDPTQQDGVFLRVGAEAQPAFMGQLRSGLEEQEAPGRVVGVDPASEQVAGQSPVIEFRVFAAQRELESGLAVLIAVARTRVAAALRQHRHDVVAKGDGTFGGRQSWRRRRHSQESKQAKQPSGDAARVEGLSRGGAHRRS